MKVDLDDGVILWVIVCVLRECVWGDGGRRGLLCWLGWVCVGVEWVL